MNVGASTEEGIGNYYAWGETDTKSSYIFSNYKFNPSGDGVTMTKYNETDGLTELEAEDDAAHVNWGGDWHIPTYAQMEELVNSCTWTYTQLNGTNGWMVSRNGNNIFLPVIHTSNDGIHDIYYQTCTVGDNLHFQNLTVGLDAYEQMLYYLLRCNGQSVRPVIDLSTDTLQ